METVTTKKLDGFTQQLERTTIALPAGQIANAESILNEIDFPTTRDEAWKYTRVSKIAGIRSGNSKGTFTENDLRQFIISEDHHTIVLVNGSPSAFFPSTTSLEGVTIKPLSECTEVELSESYNEYDQRTIFDHLNTVYLTDGVLIAVEKNVKTAPISLIHLFFGEQSIHHSRVIIKQEVNSKLEVFQYFTSFHSSGSYGNNVTSVRLENGAQLDLYKIEHSLNNNFLITNETCSQERNSRLSIHTHTLSCNFVRNSCEIVVNGEYSETNLSGTYLLKQQEHVDNHTCIDHRVANCLSNEKYKGVMGDKSTGVFNGKVFVRKDAQKINAFQSNANILTSEDATVNSKPELEIYADDVKCSHGSTTGQLDEEALFYLRARGISETAAKNLLIEAFLEDVLSLMENETAVGIVRKNVRTYFSTDL